jgi:hypothetical protein
MLASARHDGNKSSRKIQAIPPQKNYGRTDLKSTKRAVSRAMITSSSV